MTRQNTTTMGADSNQKRKNISAGGANSVLKAQSKYGDKDTMDGAIPKSPTYQKRPLSDAPTQRETKYKEVRKGQTQTATPMAGDIDASNENDTCGGQRVTSTRLRDYAESANDTKRRLASAETPDQLWTSTRSTLDAIQIRETAALFPGQGRSRGQRSCA